ncbi:MAG: NADH-quinone oxidoreductase subunit F [Planctomycetes bacterium RBG_13_60_9]|nr:MAG: NADH-quinone oxidoreductase subunit F [Planctomycetes bacterium RBG_13_60_9]
MERPLTKNIKPGEEPLDITGYEQAGGYQALRKAMAMSAAQVRHAVAESTLRGRGGAGFPTGQKWNFVPMGDKARHPKFLGVNADEMEPGPFKDRLLLEGDPNLVVESAIISSYAIEADVAYIFLRGEYTVAAERLTKAIAQAYGKQYLGKNILDSSYSLDMYLHTSAGRYMCGEENGLLDALEGRRPIPRTRPPHPVTVGLWGKPTVVNNVETLANVPYIISNGAEAFKALSHTSEGGTKLYGISGRVKRTGVWELPMGTTLGEIFHEHAGGMIDGYKFRALQPGGASTSFVLEQHFDTRMDFSSMEKTGSRLGTGTIIVLDDKTCPVGAVLNMEEFFARESCGWCTPCREGLPWVRNLLRAIEHGRGMPRDIEILQEHTWLLGMGHTFCALAPGAVMPLEGALKYFREDFDEHIRRQRCPWR